MLAVCRKNIFLSHFKYWMTLAVFLSFVNPAYSAWPQIVKSKDGSDISFEVMGQGEITLVFIHGWNCDSRYWREQVRHFAKDYQLVMIDLAGHGHSGSNRSLYSMRAFAEDVRAVIKKLNLQKVILIGHSMGGAVIAETARIDPKPIIGLVGVDTFSNIENSVTQGTLQKMRAPLEKDFQQGVKAFVGRFLLPTKDPQKNQLREWILADMAATSPSTALSALDEMMGLYISGEAAKMFAQIPVPVIAVNADLWPIDYQANRRHMLSFEAIVLKNADHFLMMNKAMEFNLALEEAIQILHK